MGADAQCEEEALSPAPWGERSTDLRSAAGTQAAASSDGPTRDRETRLPELCGKRRAFSLPSLPQPPPEEASGGPTPRLPAPLSGDRSPLGLGGAEDGAQIRDPEQRGGPALEMRLLPSWTPRAAGVAGLPRRP
ncbi:hypothetical protein NDU88_004030 [Pleurodeles waltl]|uniref:Uncharacterized protein n=1 Tax=Pleurodeles waltl TaxID=8319 RepID=A0AAV7W736_PLEWA|nr:hypothetical protein NDU88_004030 [Pleurodeles waltl]